MIWKFPIRGQILVKIDKAVTVALKMVCLLYYCNTLSMFCITDNNLFPNRSNSVNMFSLRQFLSVPFQTFCLKSHNYIQLNLQVQIWYTDVYQKNLLGASLETRLKISLFVINGKDWRSEVQRYTTVW